MKQYNDFIKSIIRLHNDLMLSYPDCDTLEKTVKKHNENIRFLNEYFPIKDLNYKDVIICNNTGMVCLENNTISYYSNLVSDFIRLMMDKLRDANYTTESFEALENRVILDKSKKGLCPNYLDLLEYSISITIPSRIDIHRLKDSREKLTDIFFKKAKSNSTETKDLLTDAIASVEATYGLPYYISEGISLIPLFLEISKISRHGFKMEKKKDELIERLKDASTHINEHKSKKNEIGF